MGKQRSGTKCRDGVQPETLTEEQGIEFHGSTSRTGKTDETVRGSRGRTLRDGSLKTSRLPQPGLLTEVECWPRQIFLFNPRKEDLEADRWACISVYNGMSTVQPFRQQWQTIQCQDIHRQTSKAGVGGKVLLRTNRTNYHHVPDTLAPYTQHSGTIYPTFQHHIPDRSKGAASSLRFCSWQNELITNPTKHRQIAANYNYIGLRVQRHHHVFLVSEGWRFVLVSFA